MDVIPVEFPAHFKPSKTPKVLVVFRHIDFKSDDNMRLYMDVISVDKEGFLLQIDGGIHLGCSRQGLLISHLRMKPSLPSIRDFNDVHSLRLVK
jgi:hypothetical protein